ncbi:hypothetical protein TRFO_37408 [Tritrichomonas foetus]|uniref:Ubiquitin-like domain-containing protein n=1 Tax=Tritrichomonas foetus TaxID=1144522 RepID=A0A1J4JG55_9EUKA|nr:hypothetical protein TRFO_37408 [Tritrichomonas foetus]|eukprot:OHS96429.1 hypothetical protein TRFO_37408 [Tritrichomonas foetus]
MMTLQRQPLQLFVCIPNHFVKKVKVIPSHKVSILNSLFQKEEKTYIYKGQVLSESNTFESYDISDFEHIVALTNQNESSFEMEKLKWIHTTQDSELFAEKISPHPKSSIALEMARIRDVRIRKVEQKRFFLAKKVHNQMNHSGISRNRDCPLSIDYSPSECPNSGPLPVCW